MTGTYINLTEAAKRSPGRPHTASIWRWMRKGVLSRSGERITLDHVRAGGKLFTTEAALEMFFRRVADADREHFRNHISKPTRPPTTGRREAAKKQAECTLRRARVLQ